MSNKTLVRPDNVSDILIFLSFIEKTPEGSSINTNSYTYTEKSSTFGYLSRHLISGENFKNNLEYIKKKLNDMNEVLDDNEISHDDIMLIKEHLSKSIGGFEAILRAYSGNLGYNKEVIELGLIKNTLITYLKDNGNVGNNLNYTGSKKDTIAHVIKNPNSAK